MENKIPNSWEHVMLKDLMVNVENKKLKSNKLREGDDVLVIRPVNLTNSGKVNLTNATLQKTPQDFRSVKKIAYGDILIKEFGRNNFKSAGQVSFCDITNDNEIYVISNSIQILRADSVRIHPKYLYFYLLYLKKVGYNKLIQNQNSKSYNLKMTLHFDTLVPLPPLEKQQQIVNILEEADLVIEKRGKVEQYLYDLLKSIFLEAFGDPAVNPKGWKVGTIADLTNSTQYGINNKANEDSSGIPILRVNNVTTQGDWDFESLKYIESDQENFKKYMVKKGDLLIARTNTREYVGKNAVYRQEEPVVFASYLIKLIANKEGNTEFISGYLNSEHGKKVLASIAKQTTSGMANINVKDLLKIPMYLPAKKLQEDYARQVEYIEKLKKKYKLIASEQELLFDSILQNSFKGALQSIIQKKAYVLKHNQGISLPSFSANKPLPKEETRSITQLVNKKRILHLIQEQFRNSFFSFEDLRKASERLGFNLSYDRLRNYLYETLEEPDKQLQLIFSNKNEESEYQILFVWRGKSE
ncbi:hypothetical protein CMV16_21870 [Peribacillus simplex]|nr:hypothetical protein CMV16_21870 [Peribacillus simplex]